MDLTLCQFWDKQFPFTITRLFLILRPLSVPCSVLMRVLAYLLERRPAPAVHISRVFLPIHTVVLPHILCLGLLGMCQVNMLSGGRLIFPT